MHATRHGCTFATCLAAALITAIAGCKSTEPDRVYTYQDLQSSGTRKNAAHVYWARHDVLNLRELGYKRIAIAEFTVEFVTEWVQPPKPLSEVEIQRLEKAKVTPPTGPDQPGTVRRSAEVNPGLYERVTEDLYVMFVKQCRQRGLEVVPSEEVHNAFGFRQLRKTSGPETQIYHYDSHNNPDVGWPMQTSAYPARGLGIILGSSWDQVEDPEVTLLQETGADVALRVRLRVGLHRGHVALQRGSKIKIVSRDVAGLMLAERSVISPEPVIIPDEFKTLDDRIDRIDPEIYPGTVREIFPTFAALAFESWFLPEDETHDHASDRDHLKQPHRY